jgi:hypothetical protein
MAIDQPTLFPKSAPLDPASIAEHIAAHAPIDSRIETDRRAAEIVELRGEDLAREQTGFPSAGVAPASSGAEAIAATEPAPEAGRLRGWPTKEEVNLGRAGIAAARQQLGR